MSSDFNPLSIANSFSDTHDSATYPRYSSTFLVKSSLISSIASLVDSSYLASISSIDDFTLLETAASKIVLALFLNSSVKSSSAIKRQYHQTYLQTRPFRPRLLPRLRQHLRLCHLHHLSFSFQTWLQI